MKNKLLIFNTFLFIIIFLFFEGGAIPDRKNIYIWPGQWGTIFYDSSPFNVVRDQMAPLGYDLIQTESLRNLEKPFLIISFDVPLSHIDYLHNYPFGKLILMLWEPPSVIKYNFDVNYHHYFSKIFTWNDDLIDCRKYIKFNYFSFYKNRTGTALDFSQKKLCTMVARNKQSKHIHELYTERIKAIEFFEKFHPNDFDLYGHGWEHRKSYKGGISDKIEILNKYKFCICYENVGNIAGYVTEKIFDSLLAGCVPIYCGASNIERYVPKNCFIARTDFSDYESLYRFMKNMTNKQYQEYIGHIQAFLKSDQARLFTMDYFVEFFKAMILSNQPGDLHP